VSAEPLILSQVVVGRAPLSTYVQPAQLQGIDPMSSKVPLMLIEDSIRAGRYAWGATKSGLPGVLVGYRLATRLNLAAGDTLIVMSIENIKGINPVTGFPDPRTGFFEVLGSFETGMFEYDNMNVYAALADVQNYIGLPADTIGMIGVNIRDPMTANEFANRLKEKVNFRDATQTWLEINGSLFNALALEKLAMAVILTLIIIVASFNIISTLMMLVREKTREIGILKSMGMTDGSIMRIFMSQGLIIGIVGTGIGLFGGLTTMYVITKFKLIELPADVYFIDHLPLRLEFFDGAMIVLASLVIAFLATINPARRASKLIPVEAIRHD
jgi:lipoprotein-releasing system permease protein